MKSKGLSSESFKAISTSDNSLNPTLNCYGTKIRVKFTGDCLNQQKITYYHGKVVNIYIVYSLGAPSSNNSDPTIKSCLFGAVTLTKNMDIDIYGFGQNVIIFGADTNSSIHVANKGKDRLILGIGPTQGLGEHSLTAEKV